MGFNVDLKFIVGFDFHLSLDTLNPNGDIIKRFL
jgi:hypothetical protein